MKIVNNSNSHKKKILAIMAIVIVLIAIAISTFLVMNNINNENNKNNENKIILTEKQNDIYSKENIPIKDVISLEEYNKEKQKELENSGINLNNIENSKHQETVKDYLNNNKNSNNISNSTKEDKDQESIKDNNEKEESSKKEETIKEPEVDEDNNGLEIPDNYLIEISTLIIKEELDNIKSTIDKNIKENSDPFNSYIIETTLDCVKNNKLNTISNVNDMPYEEWLKVINNWLFYNRDQEFSWLMLEMKSENLFNNIVKKNIYSLDFSNIKNQAIITKETYDESIDDFTVIFEMLFTNEESTFKAYFGIENGLPKLLDIKEVK